MNAVSQPDDSIKLKLTIAYDGTNYKGWQIQKTGVTIQQKVEDALGKLFPSITHICGSSRTDSGVHALGMVAHVELLHHEFHMSIHKVPLAINAFLPKDIRIVDAQQVPITFHARYDSSRKLYHYHIWNHRIANPLMRMQSWHVPVKLDIALMRKAAVYFLGKHDFQSLCVSRNYTIEHAMKTIYQCNVQQRDSLVTIIIEGDGFLYKMCRAIVAALYMIGVKKWSPNMIPKLLQKRSRQHIRMIAPAHGLTLVRVCYKQNCNV